MNLEEKIKKLSVEKYYMDPGLYKTPVCPDVFTAEIYGTGTMEELLTEIVKKIPSNDYDVKIRCNMKDAIAAFNNNYSTIDDKAVDEELGVGAFVLTSRTSTGMGWNIKEGIYCIKRDGDILKGKLIRYRTASIKEKFKEYIASSIKLGEGGIIEGEGGIIVDSIIRDPEEYREKFTYDLKSL